MSEKEKDTRIPLDEARDKATLEKWINEAKEIIPDDPKVSLDAFAKRLLEEYKHDYGSCVWATTALAMAAITYMSRAFGITVFQHGCVLSQLLTKEFGIGRKIGWKILDFDDVLFPQYMDRFTESQVDQKFIDRIREEAKKRIQEHEREGSIVATAVLDHWKKIADGWIPPFLKVK